MDAPTARRIAAALAEQMSLEEKASQIHFRAPAIPRLGIPACNWWNEALHGVARAGTATVFPQAINLAAAFDEDLMRCIGDAIAVEARAKHNAAAAADDRDIYKGLTFWAPNINIFRDPRWGRGHETYGEDPYLTARMGVSYIRGLQGDGGYLKAAAGVKHFAAHSGPESGRGAFNAVVSAKDMEETYLPAFEAAVREGGAAAVMGAYNGVNGAPCCASVRLLKDTLREKWGFTGVVASDAWAIENLAALHRAARDNVHAAALALKSGCDLNIGGDCGQLIEACRQGLVTEEEIGRACVRALTVRVRLGMTDADCPYNAIGISENDTDAHDALALRAARESVVLLKNNGTLPLDPNRLKTVLVVGPNADSRACLEGNYCGTSSRYVPFLAGLRAAGMGAFRVLYAQGCFMVRDRDTFLSERADDRLAEAFALAATADVIIACVGLDASIEGEDGDTSNQYPSGDKRDLELPAVQQRLLTALAAAGKPLVTVVAAGSTLRVETGDAIVWAGYPGQAGGTAVADILLGKVSPSGRLPVTFYRSADDLPDFCDYAMTNRTYRYYRGEVLYPFGFGLSYTRFVYGDAEWDGGRLYFTIQNAGARDAEETAQAYIRCDSPDAPLHPVLCAFRRVFIRAGESARLSLPIAASAFTVVNRRGERIPCASARLYIGGSQPDGHSEELTGQKCLRVNARLAEDRTK